MRIFHNPADALQKNKIKNLNPGKDFCQPYLAILI